MQKKIGGFLAVAVIGFLSWYLFIKPHDYAVSFKTKALPGVVKQSLLLWTTQQDSIQILDEQEDYIVENVFGGGDSIHQYRWEMKPINDSLTNVTAYVSDIKHSFINKISIPFQKTVFEETAAKTVIDFRDNLKNHLSQWKVRIEGASELEGTYCAYTTVNTIQIGKAKGMMINFPLLNSILAQNNIALNGSPFIEVTSWNKLTGALSFDFCYPILKTDNLPSHPDLKYKEFKPRKAIKATYNGNYSTSDRAWYALLNYAKKEKIEVVELPVEVFFNQPVSGGYELNWKAEIYMPLKN